MPHFDSDRRPNFTKNWMSPWTHLLVFALIFLCDLITIRGFGRFRTFGVHVVPLRRRVSTSGNTVKMSCDLQKFLSNNVDLVKSWAKSGAGKSLNIAPTHDFGKQDNILRIYVGNEASDADSIISSIAAAYLASKAEDLPYRPSKATGRVMHHISLVSVPRSDLVLRPDVQLLLTDLNMPALDYLLCEEDIPWANLRHFYGKIEVVLLDSNVISKQLGLRISNENTCMATDFEVVSILDHHKDLNQYLDAHPRIVAFDGVLQKASAGSTCSLVCLYYANLLLSESAHNVSDSDAVATALAIQAKSSQWPHVSALLDPEISYLLLSVVMLDTYNTNEKLRKNTIVDDIAIAILLSNMVNSSAKSQMIPSLLNHLVPELVSQQDAMDHSAAINTTPLVTDLSRIYDRLANAKFDRAFWHQLTAADALRLDYKAFDVPQVALNGSTTLVNTAITKTIGISSVLLPILPDLVFGMTDFAAACAQYLSPVGDDSVDMLVVLSLFSAPDGTMQRELLITSNDVRVVDCFRKYSLRFQRSPVLGEAFPNDFPAPSVFLGLEEVPALLPSHFIVYKVENISASRKQLAPLLTDHFAKYLHEKSLE